MNPERFKQLRKEHGYTQAELAKKLGVGISTVAMWEAGKRTPKFEQLDDMSQLYDRSLSYITGASDDANSITPAKKELDELAMETLAEDSREIFEIYMSLDEYGKKNVDRLVRSEMLRCRDQGTLIDTSKVRVCIKINVK